MNMKQVNSAAMLLVQVLDNAADNNLHNKVSEIVKLHAKLAVGAAWVPIPGADMIAAAGNIWTMYVRINNAINVPFGENVLKSIASGVGANLISFLPAVGVSSFLKLIPGIGTVTSGFIMSGTIYAVTIAAAIVYMKALTSILQLQSELSETNLKSTIDSIMGDSDSVKKILRQAQNDYKADSKI